MGSQHSFLRLGCRTDVGEDVLGVVLSDEFGVGLLELLGKGLFGEGAGVGRALAEFVFVEGKGEDAIEVLGLVGFAGEVEQVVVLLVLLVVPVLLGLALHEGE